MLFKKGNKGFTISESFPLFDPDQENKTVAKIKIMTPVKKILFFIFLAFFI